jgi:cytochrome c553
MIFQKKYTVVICLASLVTLGLAATKPAEEGNYSNLKVLPKNISHEEMDRIMHSFNKDLGVKCGFCHGRTEDGRQDFVNDKKPEKNITRDMMKMTMKLNKKYFHVSKPAIGDSLSIVTCYSCHHGNAHVETSGDQH